MPEELMSHIEEAIEIAKNKPVSTEMALVIMHLRSARDYLSESYRISTPKNTLANEELER